MHLFVYYMSPLGVVYELCECRNLDYPKHLCVPNTWNILRHQLVGTLNAFMLVHGGTESIFARRTSMTSIFCERYREEGKISG